MIKICNQDLKRERYKCEFRSTVLFLEDLVAEALLWRLFGTNPRSRGGSAQCTAGTKQRGVGGEEESRTERTHIYWQITSNVEASG